MNNLLKKILIIFFIVFTYYAYAQDNVDEADDPCASYDNCTVVAESCDDDPSAEACNVLPDYGGVKESYVVEECKVTIFNDGPVRFEHVVTGEFCDAPIPEDHKFSKEVRTYKEGDCTVTEYEMDAVKVCPK
jgi:hypothetical protein